MLDDRHDTTRNQQEYGSPNMGPADKFSNRAGAAKAAPGLFGKPHSEPSVPAITNRPRLELSLTQILGSTGAAVTAAFLGSRLGVAGTLIGAALASIISVVGGAIYTTSIKATRHRVALAIGAVRGGQDDELQDPTEPQTPWPIPSAPGAVVRTAQSVTPVRIAAPVGSRRPALRGVLVGAALSATVFAGALAVVTGYETVSGTALAGGQAGSLTVLGGRQADADPDPTPGRTPAVTSSSDAAPTTSSGSAKTEPTAPTESATTTVPKAAPATTTASKPAAANTTTAKTTAPSPTPSPTASSTGSPAPTSPQTSGSATTGRVTATQPGPPASTVVVPPTGSAGHAPQ